MSGNEIATNSKNSTPQSLGKTLVIAMLSCALLACSVGRVYQVKEQFCDFDNNFSYTTGDNPSFVFGQPVLLEKDVQAMIGYDPSEVLEDEKGLRHRYVIEKYTVQESPTEALTFELRYVRDSGKARLQSIHLPPEVAASGTLDSFTDPEAIAAAAAEICSSTTKLSLRSVEEDINPRFLENLPDKEQMIAMIGAPSWESEEENALIYEYHWLGSSAIEAPVRMVVWFDEADIKPLRMNTQYRFIRSRADLEKGKVNISYDF